MTLKNCTVQCRCGTVIAIASTSQIDVPCTQCSNVVHLTPADMDFFVRDNHYAKRAEEKAKVLQPALAT